MLHSRLLKPWRQVHWVIESLIPIIVVELASLMRLISPILQVPRLKGFKFEIIKSLVPLKIRLNIFSFSCCSYIISTLIIFALTISISPTSECFLTILCQFLSCLTIFILLSSIFLWLIFSSFASSCVVL